MARRPCLDCGTLTTGTRCPPCTTRWHQARDQRRGNRHQRGYNHQHETIRAKLMANLKPGDPCPRCGQPMWPTQRLHAGHPIGQGLRVDRTAKPDHLEHGWCNEGANG